jgi:Fic family protein
MLSLIAEIDQFKGKWSMQRVVAPERLDQLRHLASVQSIGSSTRIEGAKLSDTEVSRLLGNLKIQTLSSRDEQEVAGYAETLNLITDSWDEIPFTENHIQQLHKTLLKYVDKDRRHRGSYKVHPNHVSAFDEEGKEVGVIFETASPFDTPPKMTELIEWTNDQFQGEDLHPLLVIGMFALHFLAIHPFQDGNGRLSRLLTTLLLLKAGYDQASYASLEQVIEKNKEVYYASLRASQKGIWSENSSDTPWLTFFLGSVKKQAEILAQKIDQETSLQERLSWQESEILALFTDRDHLSISEIVEGTGGNRNTLKKHVGALVDKGLLLRHGRGRGVYYTRL